METNLSLSLSRLKDILNKGKMGAVIIPPNSSIDLIASATSLYLTLVKKGITTSLICATKVEADLFGVEKFQTSPSAPGNNLIITFPYTEGSIDRIDSFIENDKFSLIIVPRPGFKKLDPQNVEFSYGGGSFDFIFIIGAPTLNSLGAIYQNNASLFQGREIINIDRHFTNTNFGTVNLVRKDISSLSELIYQIIKELQLEIDKDIATNLYYGIAAATNNFTSYSTTADTFQTLAELLRAGAVKKIFKKQVNESSLPQQLSPFRDSKKTKNIEDIEKENQTEETKTPSEWLKPKIFRGSGLI